MAKVLMKKIELAGLMTDCKNIIDLLQRGGFIELSLSEEKGNFSLINTSSNVAQINKFLSVAAQAKETLGKYTSHKSAGMLKSMLEPRKPISLSAFLEKSDKSDELLDICFSINSDAKAIQDAQAQIIRNRTKIDSLMPWAALDIAFSQNETRFTRILFGSFNEYMTQEKINGILASLLPDLSAFELEIVSASPEMTCFMLICLKENETEIDTILHSQGFIGIAETSGRTARENIEALEKQINDLREEISRRIENIKAFGEKYDDISFLEDCFILKKDKYTELSKVLLSSKLFILNGYIPEKEIKRLETEISKSYDIAFLISDIPYEDENAPVLLKNNAFSAPLESVTSMYSLPGRDDVDPTSMLSFFYYFFFGMMFSDAAYGLIMVAGTAYALLKFKMEQKMRNTCKMFMYCGISTVVWGVLYGSFFGDIINVVRAEFLGLEKIRLFLWIDPLQDIMKLLVVCFIFGLVHLFTGVSIKAVNLLRKKHYMDAFCESIPAFLSVFGIAPTFIGLFSESINPTMKSIGMKMFLGGIILVVLTGGRASKSTGGKAANGLFSAYNLLSGYLGDVLSYSRLLALGLATGVIATVVNLLVTIPQSLITRIFMMLFVFPLGQLINFAINIIGAYVHACRLQYVEFFSKFYEGGGRGFEPLRVNAKSFRFEE